MTKVADCIIDSVVMQSDDASEYTDVMARKILTVMRMSQSQLQGEKKLRIVCQNKSHMYE